MDNQPAQPTPAPPVPTIQKTILDILLANKVIDQTIYDQVKLESVTTGRQAEEILKEKALVKEEPLVEARATLYNIPYVRPSELGASPEALNVVPQSVAKRYNVLPFAVDKANNSLSVAMANPLDLTAIGFLETKSGMRITPFMASLSEIQLAIQERYAQSLSSEVVEALRDVEEPKKRVVDVTQLGQVIREAPVAKIVETVLSFAVKSGASDVHIEPQENRTRIRYRIDGILQEKLVLPREVHNSVISRIKILADLKIDERRLPQDGRFAFSVNSEEVDLRISTLPTVHGEKVVMRLLKKTNRVPTFTELGLRGRALRNVEENIQKPNGIILITGPTGSGKTTTLYSVLSKISTPQVNVVTLEDPVEYEIPGVNQVQVNSQAGLNFASGLRSFLRQDPNVIMVGEIRDHETAELAVQASLTGHMVFSTLHTNSAAGALPRLVDMKIEPFLLASSMTMGGLHGFNGWQKPMLTDSGGFQVSSLGLFRKDRGSAPTGTLKPPRIDEEGVTFWSHLNGSEHRFTAEKSMQIQKNLGADIIMAFDEATPDQGKEYAQQAMERTHRWLTRSIHEWQKLENSKAETVSKQYLFGIIQGGNYSDLRKISAEYISSQNLPGIALGGGSVGADRLVTSLNVSWVRDFIDRTKPFYLMGVGVNPEDAISAILDGADMFDCVAPTRLARTGILYSGNLSLTTQVPSSVSWKIDFESDPQISYWSEFKRGRISISNAKYTRDASVIDSNCECYTCRNGFSRSYLRHLFQAKELLYYRLASIHNLHFMINIVLQMRHTIERYAV